MPEPVIHCQREWPWGIAVVGDPADQEQVPVEFGDAQVLATGGTVVCKIQHEIDGAAIVEVVLGPHDEGLILVYDGQLSLPSGDLHVSDAAGEQSTRAQVAPGRYCVRVWADEVPVPTRLLVSLDAR